MDRGLTTLKSKVTNCLQKTKRTKNLGSRNLTQRRVQPNATKELTNTSHFATFR